ncbi:lysozyme inhibitor LprI family protein [Clostridium mediterraneense]|uniref:lysozyme inhibitor LprI family protein n=1 Tax=Clostridium mediterraneense TaxID=1805472 RepID=UPI0008295AE8|nr:lysozyme inhibitor LprI family protein [Clostridium mediterraneense]
MKKGFLTIIVVAIIGILLGMGIEAASKSGNSINNLLTAPTSKNHSNNNSMNNSMYGSSNGLENESNRVVSINSNEDSSHINTNNNDSNSNTNNTNNNNSNSDSSFNVTLQNQAVLSTLAPQYLNDFQNIIIEANNISRNSSSDAQMCKNGQQIYNLWNNELNKLYDNIEENLTTSEFNFLKYQELQWISYRKNSVATIANQNLGSMKALDEGSAEIEMTKERCYYLFFYYLYDNNTSLDLSKLLDVKPTANLKNFEEVGAMARQEFLNMGTNEQSIVDTYANVNDIWTKEINNVYRQVLGQFVNDNTNTEFVKREISWINYKSNEINLAEGYYNTNAMKSIAKYKVSIALTQARTIILLL